MKRYIFSAAIIIILAGLGFAYLASKENEKTDGPVKEAVAESLSKEYDRPASAFTVEVSNNTEAFARGTYNETLGGGGIWFAAKTDNGWELVSAGNGIAPCGDISGYDFPKDMIPQCIDTQNGNKLIER